MASRDQDSVVFEHDREQVTVGDLREWHCVRVICQGCRAIGHISPIMFRRFSKETRIADLAPLFKCSRCGVRSSDDWRIMKIGRNA